jgi:hypothetical protein
MADMAAKSEYLVLHLSFMLLSSAVFFQFLENLCTHYAMYKAAEKIQSINPL